MLLHWLHTSDIHGVLTSKDGRHGMDCIAGFVSRKRREWGQSLILTDGGDILHGSPYTYYYNNVRARGTHGIASLMNSIGYDASVLGNHDIEAGRDVLGRWIGDCHHPVLAANISGADKAGILPYVIIRRCGLRIALFGLTTPAIDHWLNASVFEGMAITDAFDAARQCLDEITKKQHPDIIVGVFHSGWSGGMEGENITEKIAGMFPEISLILYGHDHHPAIHELNGTLCVNPGSLAMSIAEVTIDTETKAISASIIPLSTTDKSPDAEELTAIFPVADDIHAWLYSQVGWLSSPLDERDAYFGPSLFIDMFHSVMLEETGADISLFSPVSFDTFVDSGKITMEDVFRLYRFETPIYTMRFTLSEIRGILERSYSLWCSQMCSPDDHALLLDYNLDGGRRLGLKHISLNMLSAAGIAYTVNLAKPIGERVEIVADASPSRTYYTVAVNSYHGNGGGEMLTLGGGIELSRLGERVVSITPHGLRHYVVEYFKKRDVVAPAIISDWHFIPEELVKDALARDREIIFGSL